MVADTSQSSLNLTSDEKRLYGQLFQQADSDKLGVVTGEVAVKFFERTKLEPGVLGEIWQLADTENRGLLTPAGFSVVLRLIGHAQAGQEPTAELARRPGPLPKFNQIDGQSQTFPPAAAPQQPPSSKPLQQQTTGALQQQTTGPIRVPPLTPDKVNEYSSLFDKAGARNGLLAGDAAKQMFEKARLPNEVLGLVWNLVDTEQRGGLGIIEFVIAMHLLASLRTGALRQLPQTLPVGLYEAAARRTPATPPQAIPRQLTAQAARPQSPLSRPPYVAPPTPAQPLSVQSTGAEWLVSPQDKAMFDNTFKSIDRSGSGFIDGEQAVPFFSNSGLSEDVLAQIWDLSDINSEGRLSRDEFAVAMYLIRQQRSKVNGRDSLPGSLPAGLIPPSLRKQPVAPSQPTAPAFDNAAFASQQPKSASDDLFGLDALSSSPESTPAPQFQAIKPLTAIPASPRSATASPSPRQPITTAFKPFAPTSSFGQGLTTQNTGGSIQSSSTSSSRGFPSQQFQRPPTSAADDLLGDNDPVISSKLTEETTELANMSNQIGNLRTQMQEVQTKKSTTAADLDNTSNQKRELEGRLAQFRTQYEQEIREVKSVEQQLATLRNDTTRLQQELAMLEGAQGDLRAQHNQVSAALVADQGENVALKDRVRVVNESIVQLKPQLEKLRSDARQQKGLVAINRKQLSTSEGERDKTLSEVNDLIKAAEDRYDQEQQERQRVDQEHRQMAESLKVEREQLSREKADFERQKVESKAAAERERAERERLDRERAEKDRIAQETAAKERTSRETAEKERMDREKAQSERSVLVPAAVESTASAVVSPAGSVSSKNPFFRRSPEPQGDYVMSPSIFNQDFGNSQGTNNFDDFFGPSQTSTITSPPPTSIHNNNQTSTDRDLTSTFSASSQHAEPPVSAEHHQIQSAQLPFRGLARSDSFSSSLRANPPASNFGMSGHATPMEEPGSPLGLYGEERETSGRQVEHSNVADHSTQSMMIPSSNTQHSREHAPGAFPDEFESVKSTPTGGSFTSVRSRQEEHAAAASSPNGNGLSDTKSREVDSRVDAPSTDRTTSPSTFQTIASYIPGINSGAEPAAGSPTSPRSAFETIASYIPGTSANAEAKAAADSPDAAASNGQHSEASNNAKQGESSTTGRKDEFPPIRELDDDSASDDDESEFGTDFNTAFPNVNTSQAGGGNGSTAPTSTGILHAAGKQPERQESLAESASQRAIPPPTEDAQLSPPTYDQTVSPGASTQGREANQFPPEFDGLLPSREMVSSPPAATSPVEAMRSPKQRITPSVSQQEVPTTSSFNQNVPHGQSATSGYEAARIPNQQSSVFNSQSMPISHDSVVPQAQESGDEFDDAFDDLSEAREFDEPNQDSFSFSRAATEEPEFSGDFDSPARSRVATGDSYQAAASPAQTPFAQPDGFVKVKSFTSFGAAPVPPSITPYSPGGVQQSTGSSLYAPSNAQQRSPTTSTFAPGASPQNTGTGYASYSAPSLGAPAQNTGGFSSFSSPAGAKQSQPSQPAAADDWDDLFSGIENNAPADSSTTSHPTNGASSDPFAFGSFPSSPVPPTQRSSAAPPPTSQPRQSYAPPSGPPPQQSSRAPPQQQSTRPPAPNPSAFNNIYGAPPPSATARPAAPGRALSAGTDHDDPILKSLTGMGYDRDKALKALEKFDYNIDAAVDALSK